MASIEFKNVTKQFDKTVVIKDLDLKIEDGSFTVLVGPSGCGKSTLLNIIAGLLPATSGAVYVDGKKVEGTGTERGVVFQQYALFPWLTVLKNVMFGLKLKGMNDAQAREIAMKYIRMVELEEFVDAYPKELSGGMKQRVAIARAYAVQPEVLLMDEPFGALDAQTRTQLQSELTKTWQEEKKTCFFITHDVEEAIFMSSKIYLVKQTPIHELEVLNVPMDYPRNRNDMGRPEIVELKEYLIDQLRKQVII